MTEEEKKAAEAAEAEKAEKEKAEAERRAALSQEERDAEDAASAEAAKKAAEDADRADLEARLAREKKAREDAEQAAAEKDFKLREAKRKEAEGGGGSANDDGDDKPLTRKDLQNILAENNQQIIKQTQSEVIVQKAKAIARNDAHANLIVEIFRNRTFPAHLTIEEQLAEAKAIADAPQKDAEIEELRRSLKGKDTESHRSGDSHRDPAAASEPKLDPHDTQAIKAGGFIWDGVKRLYKKPLAGGKKFLYFNPVSKKRWSQ